MIRPYDDISKGYKARLAALSSQARAKRIDTLSRPVCDEKICEQCKRTFKRQAESKSAWTRKTSCSRACIHKGNSERRRIARVREAERKTATPQIRSTLDIWLYAYKPMDAVCAEAA